MFRKASREPNFDYFKMMLEKQPTPRPVMFDFIIGPEKEKFLTKDDYKIDTELDRVITRIKAFDSAGYDFAPIIVRGMEFNRRHVDHHFGTQTKSLNEESLIIDPESFNAYRWPSVDNADFSIVKKAAKHMHPKSKLIIYSHDGILENAIGIVGYENLCYLLYDDEDLVKDIFHEIGSRIEQYFLKALAYDEIGAILCNDDWGFNTQTMVSPNVLRKYVFPWYKKIVEAAHKANKKAILHSCGYYYDIIDDIINDMKFDGRQSYEDKIVPVEKAYEELYPKLAVLGGIDIDFLTRATPDEIYKRSKQMIERTKDRGGYAIGSGNSIPDYIPNENYLALLKAGLNE